MEDAVIYQELKSINEKLAGLASLREYVERHDELLHGNGREGMVVRLDRLEQKSNTNRWLINGILGSGGLAGSLIGLLEWFRH